MPRTSRFALGNSPVTHCIEDWLGPKAGLNGKQKDETICFRRGSIPGPPSA